MKFPRLFGRKTAHNAGEKPVARFLSGGEALDLTASDVGGASGQFGDAGAGLKFTLNDGAAKRLAAFVAAHQGQILELMVGKHSVLEAPCPPELGPVISIPVEDGLGEAVWLARLLRDET